MHHRHITLPGRQRLIAQVDFNPAIAIGGGRTKVAAALAWFGAGLDTQALAHPDKIFTGQPVSVE